jgi:pimeloyl-ACP methyl ester carboxylesterase
MKTFKIFFKTVAYLITFVMVLALIGIIIEQTLRWNSIRNIQPEGNFLQVNGNQLHYVLKGSGNVTVIFDSGIDMGGHLSWRNIQNEVSKFANTLSYDRAGILWSERGSREKNSKNIVSDLQCMIDSLNCKKPYIVVAHSFAGLHMREFIALNKDDIAGIIFIDVSHPDQKVLSQKEFPELSDKGNNNLLNRLAYLTGIWRFLNISMYPNLANNDTIEEQSKLSFRSIRACTDEINAMGTIYEEVKKYDFLGNIPTTIITADPEYIYRNVSVQSLRYRLINFRRYLQNDLCNISTNSKLIEVKNSGHFVHHFAQSVVIEEILKVIKPEKFMNFSDK